VRSQHTTWFLLTINLPLLRINWQLHIKIRSLDMKLNSLTNMFLFIELCRPIPLGVGPCYSCAPIILCVKSVLLVLLSSVYVLLRRPIPSEVPFSYSAPQFYRRDFHILHRVPNRPLCFINSYHPLTVLLVVYSTHVLPLCSSWLRAVPLWCVHCRN
jgi:hypothetical protein